MSNVINLYNPPNNLSYQYDVQNIEEPTDYELGKMKKDIKHKINPKIESGRKWSPAKKKRVIAITCIAVAAILLVAPVAPLLAVNIVPIGVVSAVVFLVLQNGSFPLFLVGLCFLPKSGGYDSIKYRQKVMRKIENYSLTEIIARHKIDDVIGYGLLDKIVPENIIQKRVRLAFYHKYKQLVRQCISIRQRNRYDRNKIEYTFNGEIRHLKNQYVGGQIAQWNRWKKKEIANLETVYLRTILGIGTLYNDEKGKLLSMRA